MAPVSSAAGRFDNRFGCDYMGSAEFELDSIPKAFGRMCGLTLSVRPVEITRKGVSRTVYFVASDVSAAYADCDDSNYDEVTGFEQVVEEFRRWFEHERPFSIEPSYFEWYFAGEFPDFMWDHGKTCTWWSLDDNVAWTLDKDVAQRLLEAFNPVAVAAS